MCIRAHDVVCIAHGTASFAHGATFRACNPARTAHLAPLAWSGSAPQREEGLEADEVVDGEAVHGVAIGVTRLRLALVGDAVVVLVLAVTERDIAGVKS